MPMVYCHAIALYWVTHGRTCFTVHRLLLLLLSAVNMLS
ncbi:hypothetical protein SOHN41_02096 [Shewanella sp. HN-41]|nr:hypothetical protein SOHN41_02096 [Shewanella sp. HN-41]